MEQLKMAICRLCSKKCVDFTAVEDYMKDVMDVILLKINLTLSEEPVMCTNCAAMLINCFEFKATCFYTHDYLVPLLDDQKISKLDLKKVYRSKHGNVDIPEDRSVCGFCMGLLKKCTGLSLDTEEGNVMLEKLILKYLPELDFSTIEEPTICVACHESLKTYSHFVTSCLIVEDKIVEYRKITGRDIIESADVLQVTSSNVSRVEDDNEIDFIREEEKLCVDSGNADEQAAQENASFANMEEQKLLLNEEIEIKTDQHDFDRCLGGVSSQPLATRTGGKKKCSVSKGGPLKTKYDCATCPFQTKCKQDLRRHNMLVHRDPSEVTMYQCTYCPFQAKRIKAISSHMSTHKLYSPMYQCRSCSYQTKYKRYLNEHKLTHKVYQCASCPFKTKYKRNLHNHKLTHKNLSKVTIYQCKSCPFQTKHITAISSHVLTHKQSSKTTTCKCYSCSYQTKYKRNLNEHKLTHKDPPETTMYQCDSCSYQTQHERNLNEHKLTHKEKTMYQCASCSFQTKYKKFLRSHMLTHKKPPEITMYQCASCLFQTKYKTGIASHVRIHKPIVRNE